MRIKLLNQQYSNYVQTELSYDILLYHHLTRPDKGLYVWDDILFGLCCFSTTSYCENTINRYCPYWRVQLDTTEYSPSTTVYSPSTTEYSPSTPEYSLRTTEYSLSTAEYSLSTTEYWRVQLSIAWVQLNIAWVQLNIACVQLSIAWVQLSIAWVQLSIDEYNRV